MRFYLDIIGIGLPALLLMVVGVLMGEALYTVIGIGGLVTMSNASGLQWLAHVFMIWALTYLAITGVMQGYLLFALLMVSATSLLFTTMMLMPRQREDREETYAVHS